MTNVEATDDTRTTAKLNGMVMVMLMIVMGRRWRRILM